MLNNVVALLGTGVAASTSSYESIATATGNGSATTLTFSSIPSTYKHLQLRLISKTNTAGSSAPLYMQFNSDTATNYAYHRLLGDGATVTSAGSATQTYIMLGGATTGNTNASVMGVSIVDVLDYASTSKYKTTRAFNGGDGNVGGGVYYLELGSGLWQSTSAISSIALYRSGGAAFDTTTTFALYGIKG